MIYWIFSENERKKRRYRSKKGTKQDLSINDFIVVD
jgi:hypothetical protein